MTDPDLNDQMRSTMRSRAARARFERVDDIVATARADAVGRRRGRAQLILAGCGVAAAVTAGFFVYQVTNDAPQDLSAAPGTSAGDPASKTEGTNLTDCFAGLEFDGIGYRMAMGRAIATVPIATKLGGGQLTACDDGLGRASADRRVAVFEVAKVPPDEAVLVAGEGQQGTLYLAAVSDGVSDPDLRALLKRFEVQVPPPAE